MSEEKSDQDKRIVEKHYIEVSTSPVTKFLNGLVGGIGWGIGLTIGTGVILYMLTIFVSKIDFVPILGQFLADVIESAQGNITTK